MGATTTYGWETPDLVDPANAPAAFLTALQDVEDTVKDTTILTYTPSWTSSGGPPSSPASLTGWYRVDHGLCYVLIALYAGPSTSGGYGDLVLTLPLPPRAGISAQVLDAKLYSAAPGGGVYRGHCDIFPGATSFAPLFPASSSDVRMSNWRNADGTVAPGTGIPMVPGQYALTNGSNVFIKGHYFV